MDFDVIIYVLIGIVWFVVSIVQATNKAKRAKQKKIDDAQYPQKTTTHSSLSNKVEPQQNKPRDIESWLSELMNVDNRVNNQSDINLDQKPNVETAIEEVHEIEAIETAEEPKRIEYEVVEDEINDYNYENESANELAMHFELRKAVIYSEILKRPYN